MLYSRFKLTALFAIVAALSCAGPTDVCGCSPALPFATIYGVVTDAEGTAVEGARIHARVGNAQCNASFRPLDIQSPMTGADGSYRSTILLLGGITTGECLEAWAEPAAGTHAVASDPVRFAVNFNWGAAGGPDSVRVDLQLKAIEEEIVLEIAPTDVACTGMYPMRCLLVRESSQAEWTYFYSAIEGFTWQPGFTYRLRAMRSRIRKPAADQSAYRYTLIEVLEKA